MSATVITTKQICCAIFLPQNSWMQCWNPHHFHADLDLACHFDADVDPDPTCHFDADADPDPDPTFHCDVDRDLDPDPSFQRKAQNLEKVLYRLIFHIFWLYFLLLILCGSMRIRIRIHNTAAGWISEPC
jgi:hypothetical protein